MEGVKLNHVPDRLMLPWNVLIIFNDNCFPFASIHGCAMWTVVKNAWIKERKSKELVGEG